MKLLPHQQEFVDKNQSKAILAWGTRVGKSYAICGWALNRRAKRGLLICPKRILGKWADDLEFCGVDNVSVVSKEHFKKLTPKNLDAYGFVIVDEAHHVASGLHMKPSQLTLHLYNWLVRSPHVEVVLATATPVASDPKNLHTLAALIGHSWDWKQYRNHFYELVRRPYAPFPFWEPKSNWRILIRPFVKKVCDIKLLSDVTTVPPQEHTRVTITLAEETSQAVNAFSDVSPAKEWSERHQLEQMGMEKIEKIRELAEGEAKVIVVCKYKRQLAHMAKELSKDREVIVLSGDTKDPNEVIRRASESTECYFLLQADCGEGFRGDSFSMLFFATMSWKFVSYDQMLGRMLHLNKQDGNQYYYLLGSQKDKDVYATIMAGKDFSLEKISHS